MRAEAAGAHPPYQELKKALTRFNREIANFTRAIGRGDFASLEGALKEAEARRVAVTAELTEIERKQAPGMLQIPPAVLKQHLEGLTEREKTVPGTI